MERLELKWGKTSLSFKPYGHDLVAHYRGTTIALRSYRVDEWTAATNSCTSFVRESPETALDSLKQAVRMRVEYLESEIEMYTDLLDPLRMWVEGEEGGVR